MGDELFLEGETLTELVGYVGQYVAAGVGVGLIFFMMGYVIYVVLDWMRGGLV